MKRFRFLIFVVLMQLTAHTLIAQQRSSYSLPDYVTSLNNLRELKLTEKLYLQTDKPYYSVGDTLRFKGYLLNADYLTPALSSGLLYIELDNEQGKNARRIMVPLTSGLAWGDIALDSVEVPNGTYTLRAYTNWMRNFGEDYVFKKNITVSKSTDNPLLVKANFKQVGNKVEAELLFSLLDGRIQAFKDVELKVMNGKRNLSKDKVVTSSDGSVKVNLTVPEGDGALSIQAVMAGNDILNIPVSINRKENTDIQFMPEGGSLVAGIACKVGFKAIGEDGKGIRVNGTVLDSNDKQIVSFESAHAGTGSFEFIPEVGQAYIAKVNGITKPYPLPRVTQNGTAIALQHTTDSVKIKILATPDAIGTYILIGQARGIVCFARPVNVTSSTTILVAKSLFPTGVARFTLFNNYLPLNERIIFINHQDNLNINITTDKNAYSIRDSIALNIQVKDKDGHPIQGNFSLGVTDNGQVKHDSLGVNLLNNLLLTSDLKGDIGEPGYYFTGNKETDLDNLMLTQGWTSYDWQEVFHPKLPYPYKPEREFAVSGKVSTAFNKPIEKSKVILVTNNPLTFKDTLTDNTGRFVFKDLFPIDTAIFALQARNKNGKEMNVKIDMDEIKPPVFTPPPFSAPWYVNSDSALLNNNKAKIDEAAAMLRFKGESNVLKVVNIKANKIIKGSKNLNGTGGADLIIDEQELVKAGKMTLEDLLYQKIVGFGASGTPQAFYNVFSYPLHFVFDGIDLHYFFKGTMSTGFNAYMLYAKKYLQYYTAEDVIGIEYMFQPKYTANYMITYGPTPGFKKPPIYIEITTRSKKGPFMQVTPGTYLFKTLPFTVAKQFYSPKYSAKNKSVAIGTDLRSTIFWESNVITNKDGKATISFYSADKVSNYTVIMEGSDMNGQLGYGKREIKVH